MKYPNMNDLADKFVLKLKKYAQTNMEIDSTNVTLAVRPVINNVLTKTNFNNVLSKIIQDAANKAASSNIELSGNIKIDTFITTANGNSGKWKIDPLTSGLKVSGSLLNNKLVSSSISSLIMKTNLSIFSELEKELNRVSSTDKQGWAGNKISNHETNINEVNVEI